MTDMNLEQARHNMIEQQIRPWNVLDERILDLLLRVPREDFVPQRYRKLAFADMEIPLGHGEVMLSPKLEARMLQVLAVRPDDRILEVGTGSGYFTALLAHLGRQVFSVDRVGEFVETAQQRLNRHGITNVALVQGDASRGWEAGAPFDAIVITGSLPVVPEAFKQALTIGGRLLAVVGSAPIMEVRLTTRLASEQWSEESLFETVVPPLRNAAAVPAFQL